MQINDIDEDSMQAVDWIIDDIRKLMTVYTDWSRQIEFVVLRH